MALQLPLTDKYGNTYPQGYRRYRWFSIDVNRKTITAIFSDYPNRAYRDAHPDDPMYEFPYTIGPEAVPAVTDSQGHTIEPAIPSFDDYMAADNADPTGYGAAIYAFAKSRPENAGAIDA